MNRERTLPKATKRYTLHHSRWFLKINKSGDKWVRYRKSHDYNHKLMRLLAKY